MDLGLKDKVAIVTGASRGIGEAIAKRLVDEGAKVMISSRKQEALEKVCSQLGDNSAFCVANSGNFEQLNNLVDQTLSKFNRIDMLVNNAATNPYFGTLMDIDESKAAKTVEVNQWGPLMLTQLCWKAWMKENGGSVLNIASVGGLETEYGIGYYNITKAALIHMTKQMAGEMGPKVRVNAIAPGLVRTYFAKVLWENAEALITKRLPLKRIGEPDDIARPAVFLLSDAASWVTGSILVVDGGSMVIPSGGVT
jgi:NAD(P)-dependent dehydrogenase (short-subunit alcohol dehydrogenase family)